MHLNSQKIVYASNGVAVPIQAQEIEALHYLKLALKLLDETGNVQAAAFASSAIDQLGAGIGN